MFKMILRFSFVFSVVLVMSIAFSQYSQAQSSFENSIAQSESLNSFPTEVHGREIIAHEFLSELYQYLGTERLWDDAESRAVLKDEIENIWKDGLLSSDFHDDVIGGSVEGLSPKEEDILFSDALARLLYQLQNGKVNPETLDQDWNYKRLIDDPRAMETVAAYFAEKDISGLIAAARPNDDVYKRLTGTLLDYVTYKQSGGWDVVGEGTAIKPEQDDPRIVDVRARLEKTTDYRAGDLAASFKYDEGLRIAITQFQIKHGLETDGVIGSGTLKAMNISVDDRIDQIKANIERSKWVGKSLEGQSDFVVVNIASYDLLLIQNGELSWRTDVVVGKDYRKTPVFTGEMVYLEFNPTWTIPPGILRKDILPKFRKDSNYLVEKGFNLYDRSRNIVDSTKIDWDELNNRFPYSIVQPPGPKNALGQVKFIFPNKHSVYLHDTPSKALFNKTARAFSSGCIRVKDPTKFAEYVLRYNDGWDRGRVQSVMDSKKQTRINLKDKLKVAVLYWTVDAIQNDVRFHEDIYDRDAAVITALNNPFAP